MIACLCFVQWQRKRCRLSGCCILKRDHSGSFSTNDVSNFPVSGALRIGSPGDFRQTARPSIHRLIAFEHLCLAKHLKTIENFHDSTKIHPPQIIWPSWQKRHWPFTSVNWDDMAVIGWWTSGVSGELGWSWRYCNARPTRDEVAKL